jgi:hypothetical protein
MCRRSHCTREGPICAARDLPVRYEKLVIEFAQFGFAASEFLQFCVFFFAFKYIVSCLSGSLPASHTFQCSFEKDAF